MTAQASRMPQASGVGVLRVVAGFPRQKDKVTAVDETRPPVNPVSAAPLARSEQARQRIADERQARNEDHQQPQ